MSRRMHLKNPERETQRFLFRTIVAAVFVLLGLLAVAARLFYLQVAAHQHFVTLSENNRLRLEPVTPTRGLIFDRNGVLLAENRPTYQLEVIPEQVFDMRDTLARLEKIINLRPDDIARFEQAVKTSRSFQPVPLRTDLSPTEVARFAVNRQDFPGVDIHARLARYYPLGAETAHAIGYVGIASAADLANLDEGEYTGSSIVGKTGIEAAYENLLHGHVGDRQVETNAQGRVVRVVDYHAPTPGNDLYLSIDAKLQQTAYEALGNNSGAVVALDPNTGEVLAMVSKPSYDPNLFVGGIDPAVFSKLNKDPNQPLFNRVLRGQYPPGSTVKPFIALAGLQYNVISAGKDIMCPGYFMLPGRDRPYRDWKKGGHGLVDMHTAIVQSCDVYFYNLALLLNINHIHDFLSQFGFGVTTGIDLAGETGGILPSPEWKQRTRGKSWYLGETVITGIGQGYMLVTPLQLASAVATMGMRGRHDTPRMLHAIGDPRSGVIRDVAPEPENPIILKSPADWDIIIHAMKDVVGNPLGTAHRIETDKYTIAGKTGTAQVYSVAADQEYDASKVPEALRDHALFIAFAPVQHPRIAIAVIVEHGGGHNSLALPVARKVLDAYLLGNPP